MSGYSYSESALEEVKTKIASGDQVAFRQLFDLYAKKLTHFATTLVRSADAAREIVDEVFIRIWKNKANIQQIQNLKVYLYTATKNTSLNYLSTRARENIIEPFDFFNVELSDESQSPAGKMITAELLRKINNAIDHLPPRCKMVFKLVREDGLSYKDVGQILNISPKTVDAQMVIAVRQIAEKVKFDFDCFPARHLKKN